VVVDQLIRELDELKLSHRLFAVQEAGVLVEDIGFGDCHVGVLVVGGWLCVGV
jgi:hypothetical protein